MGSHGKSHLERFKDVYESKITFFSKDSIITKSLFFFNLKLYHLLYLFWPKYYRDGLMTTELNPLLSFQQPRAFLFFFSVFFLYVRIKRFWLVLYFFKFFVSKKLIVHILFNNNALYTLSFSNVVEIFK